MTERHGTEAACRRQVTACRRLAHHYEAQGFPETAAFWAEEAAYYEAQQQEYALKRGVDQAL